METRGMKNLSVNQVPDFAKQKQKLALHFRDSAHSRGKTSDRTLRNAEENQQNDMSLNFSEDPIICFFRSGSGVNATFSNSFRFNEIEGNGAPGETRTRDPLLISRSNSFAKSCQRSG